MEDKKLTCEIVTPEKIVYSGQVDMVIAPGSDGELGILPLHTPIITMLKPGELRLKIGERQEYVLIYEGYLEVREDKVSVLVEDAEFATQIDLEEAKAAKEKAEAELQQALEAGQEADIEIARTRASRAINRLSLAERLKKKI